MRELIGKIPTKDPAIVEVVYLAEMVRCLECEQTRPVGIEVVTVKKNGGARKVLRHVCYCRGHGLDYERRAQSRPIHPHGQCETSLRFSKETGDKHAILRREFVEAPPPARRLQA